MTSTILVVGSTNTDMVVKTKTLPAPGETVLGGAFFMNPGGKGANQAVAAARLGGQVGFVANLGDDLFGKQAIAQFKKEGIDCRHIGVIPDTASGVALITVDEKGENIITVAPGANATLSVADIKNAAGTIAAAAVILVQLEIPIAAVEAVADIAARAGKTIILNPAPAQPLAPQLLKRITIITPNETEAGRLTGIPVTDIDSATKAAASLYQQGIPIIIITLGKNGALVYAENHPTHLPAPPVTAIDTTAAGDIFNGALAVALAEGQSIPDAASFAIHAAALSVTRPGAQSAAPGRQETLSFMAENQRPAS